MPAIEPIDEEIVATVLRSPARRLGSRARVTASGAAARAWVARNAPMTPDERRRFDVVVFASACLLPVAYAYRHAIRASGLRYLIGITTLICAVCYAATKRLVGVVQRLTLKRGMFFWAPYYPPP